MSTLLGIITGVVVVLGVLVAVARPILRYIAQQRARGASVDLLGVALAFAEGYDAAKPLLPPETRALVSGKLQEAAERAGVHSDTQAFLDRFGFNPPTDPAPPAS